MVEKVARRCGRFGAGAASFALVRRIAAAQAGTVTGFAQVNSQNAEYEMPLGSASIWRDTSKAIQITQRPYG